METIKLTNCHTGRTIEVIVARRIAPGASYSCGAVKTMTGRTFSALDRQQVEWKDECGDHYLTVSVENC